MKIIKIIKYGIPSGVILSGIFVLWANYSINNNTASFVTNDVNKLPVCKTGLLLGTSKKLRKGVENPYFFYRIDAAVILFNSGKIKYIIASGDNGGKYYNEPDDMKEELIKRGIPESAIFTDYAGFRTLDSVLRAKEIFGQDSLIIISQKFHNERAIFIAQNNNMTAFGFNARNIDSNKGLKVKIRELFARSKAYIDYYLNIQPKYYGEKIVIN